MSKCIKCEQRRGIDEERLALIDDLQEALQKQNRRVTLLNEMYSELQEGYRKLKDKYENLLSGYAEGSTSRRADKGSGGNSSSEGANCCWSPSHGTPGNSGAV